VPAKLTNSRKSSEPTKDSPRYTEPFAFAQKGTIKATSYDRTFDKSSPVPVKELDIPASNYTVIYPKDEKTIAMFDGNGYTTFYLPKGKQEIRFPAVKRNKIRFVATRIIDNQPLAGIGEFSVITE